ncbi:MAG: hypothetical protein JOY55_01330 [Mycobacterium sp.]|nr:hypothetical protein [Mycobacterium sp.]MBV8290461.1 hypothetical protein [Mycobacterium sp.]
MGRNGVSTGRRLGQPAASGRRSTSGRGYGWQHQQIRAAVAKRVATGRVRCCRCGKPIAPHQKWHLDHADHAGARARFEYKGASHAHCNVSAAHGGTPAPRPQPTTRPPALAWFDTASGAAPWEPPGPDGMGTPHYLGL